MDAATRRRCWGVPGSAWRGASCRIGNGDGYSRLTEGPYAEVPMRFLSQRMILLLVAVGLALACAPATASPPAQRAAPAAEPTGQAATAPAAAAPPSPAETVRIGVVGTTG